MKESPRNVLVLTERVQQVDDFAQWIESSGFTTHTGVPVIRLHGKVSHDNVENARLARIVVASYPLANEALDIPHLDTIVTLTPFVGFIEQIVGRIVRIAKHKRVPLVVDWVDPVGLFAGMARTRSRWYSSVGVADVREVVVTADVLQDPQKYASVKPSTVVAAWLQQPDPWNLTT